MGALALTVVTGWSLSWAFTFIGTVARSAQSVQGGSMMLLFPLTFLSNAFVPVETLPKWLAQLVRFYPFSCVIMEIRVFEFAGELSRDVDWSLDVCVVV